MGFVFGPGRKAVPNPDLRINRLPNFRERQTFQSKTWRDAGYLHPKCCRELTAAMGLKFSISLIYLSISEYHGSVN